MKLRASKHTRWEQQNTVALRQSLVWREMHRQQATLQGLTKLPFGSGFDFTGVVLRVGLRHRS